MLKIIRDRWDQNHKKLREALKTNVGFNYCHYSDLVKLTFGIILNEDNKFDLDGINEIDNGDYQGTLLYLIPFQTYQPCEYEYLMTYVGYGSCGRCDALQAIQDNSCGDTLSEEQVSDLMTLCKDILTNTIKPYNHGWREDENYKVVEE